MTQDHIISRYFPAAKLEGLPDDLDEPHYAAMDTALRRAAVARIDLATSIWRAADDDAGRIQAWRALDRDAYDAETLRAVDTVLKRQLEKPRNRLPTGEIEFALGELGLLDEANGVLTDEEKRKLDVDGYLDLGPLIPAAQLEQMRRRYDDAIEAEADTAGHEVSQMHGIGRVSGTVVKPMNRDGLLDVVFMHQRLLAAVRHVLGPHFKYSSTNYHCPLPRYGHQGIHADWGWGVSEPEVVNAIWMPDDVTEENGPTRVVPGTHRSGQHPHGRVTHGEPIDPNAPVEGEVRITGSAGSCMVYNAHLWHGGTQNRTNGLRRSQHAFFTRSHRAPQTDAAALLDPQVLARLGRVERAVLDLP